MREIGPRSQSLQIPVADLVATAREGMQELAERVGVELMGRAMDVERVLLTEGPERAGYKWGSQPGYVFWNGRKIMLANKRVRTMDGKQEVPLRSYAKFQEDGVEGRIALRDLMRGVSTREYREGAEGFLRGYGEAKKALLSCMRELERINPSAAASLREGLEETLTLHRLGVPAALRKSLSTTNTIESPFSYAREKTRRVKYWRGGDQVQRRTASALLKAEKTWRKVRGYTLMPKLLEALVRRENGQEANR